MSRIYTNGYRIEYPNELAYAGMPMIVRVADANNYIGVGITIKVGEDYHTETRTLYNGGATFDIARYAQMAYINKALGYTLGEDNTSTKSSPLSESMQVVVSLTNSASATITALSFQLIALYGYIGIGQTNGAERKRKWFVNYPQSLDFYVRQGADVLLSLEDDEYYNLEEIIDGVAQIYIDISRRQVPATFKRDYAVGIAEGEAVYISGDTLIEGDIRYYLEIDRSTSGVYLRWLDHLGQWCYYLFRPTGRNYTSKEVQSWQDGVLRDTLTPENGVYVESAQAHRQYSQQESISLGAKLVDAETFDFLLTLTNSPIVEVLTNATEYQANNNTTPLWERVAVVGGSYARTNAPLQDFTVSIVRNTQTSQML